MSEEIRHLCEQAIEDIIYRRKTSEQIVAEFKRYIKTGELPKREGDD